LAGRVRLLEAGETIENDPECALSVAVAALHARARPEVRDDEHAAVLDVWSKRHRDLTQSCNQVTAGCTQHCASSSLAT
jgi:hypothetical protein